MPVKTAVSVIIPVYNAGMHLESCLQSVIDQTCREIEIIIVNDGSSDNSDTIIKEFCARDKRIQYIYQQNSGVSAARNKGLEIAKGDWISFVDADDWLESGMLKTLYGLGDSNEAGMAICNVDLVKKGRPKSPRLKSENELFDFKGKPERAVEKMMNFEYDYANWNKLYRKKIISDYKLRFDENISIGEDLLFNLHYLHFIDRIAYVGVPLYNYRIHELSTMSLNTDKRIEQFDLQFRKYKDYAKKNNMTKEWEIYRRIMAKGFYNVLIPLLVTRIKKDKQGRSESVKVFCRKIAKLDADLFYYPKGRIGIQWFKKKLLEHRQFLLFSKLIGFKNF